MRVDAAMGSGACWRQTLMALQSHACKLIAGRRHRYVFAAAAPERGVNSPQQAVVRVDTATGRVAAWRPGPLVYTGEPVLVPKASEVG